LTQLGKTVFVKILTLIIAMSFSCANENLPVLETGSQKTMPLEWIDLDTGHKVIRLSCREGSNRSFYFHNNPFIPAAEGENDKMVFYGDVGKTRQLFSIDLKTLAIQQLTDRPTRFGGEIVARKRREVFYQARDSVFATGIDNQKTRLVFVFPDSLRGNVTTLNADETILAGVTSDREKFRILRQFPAKGDYFERIFEAKIPHALFTLNTETGELKIIHRENAWLNHVQFSPTDPDLLMYCHEGPWHKLERIWNISITKGNPQLMHARTVEREIAGHEFWSPDGNTIWYDLQIPRGETFYLAGVNLKTGERVRYGMKRDEWSIHFNISPDQKVFCGDGGDSSQVARAKDGMWLYLFHPEGDSLRSERLVNMKHYDYHLEPNVHFTPDGKWIIFRANFEGNSQVYAVEVRKNR
jgi:oligogalacturonide lyase